MRVIKTSEFQRLAVFLAGQWQQSINEVMRFFLEELSSPWRESLSQFDNEEAHKNMPMMVRDFLEAQWMSEVPESLKNKDGWLRPEMQKAVEDYLAKKFHVQVDMTEPYPDAPTPDLLKPNEQALSPEEVDSLEEQWAD